MRPNVITWRWRIGSPRSGQIIERPRGYLGWDGCAWVANVDSSYELVPPEDYRVAEVRLFNDAGA